MRSVEEVIKNYKHVCWYPSAGSDYRALLFLSDWYYKKNDVPMDKGQVLPDLFVMTDYAGFPLCYSDAYDKYGADFLKPGFCLVNNAYFSNSTKITVKSVERLRDLNLSFDRELAGFDNNSMYNSAFLMEVDIDSMLEGVVTRYGATVLYVTVLNESFYNELIIPNHIKMEYQVLVRYGEGICGGAKLHPSWIIASYKELGTKYLFSEADYVAETEGCPKLKQLYSVDSKQWSGHDEIRWYKIIGR